VLESAQSCENFRAVRVKSRCYTIR